MKVNIHQIINSLVELEAKGCRTVFFEYSGGMFMIRIYSGDASAGKIVYQKIINLPQEQAELDKLSNLIETLKNRVFVTHFQCYRQEFVKGEKSGKWEKTKPVFEFGSNAVYSMLIDGSGYYVDDPENEVLYFVDMRQLSEIN